MTTKNEEEALNDSLKKVHRSWMFGRTGRVRTHYRCGVARVGALRGGFHQIARQKSRSGLQPLVLIRGDYQGASPQASVGCAFSALCGINCFLTERSTKMIVYFT